MRRHPVMVSARAKPRGQDRVMPPTGRFIVDAFGQRLQGAEHQGDHAFLVEIIGRAARADGFLLGKDHHVQEHLPEDFIIGHELSEIFRHQHADMHVHAGLHRQFAADDRLTRKGRRRPRVAPCQAADAAVQPPPCGPRSTSMRDHRASLWRLTRCGSLQARLACYCAMRLVSPMACAAISSGVNGKRCHCLTA
jgi:hypothetical protein